MDGRNKGFIKVWIAEGWKERATDRPGLKLSSNLAILFPL
jgi:hypothetical protein